LGGGKEEKGKKGNDLPALPQFHNPSGRQGKEKRKGPTPAIKKKGGARGLLRYLSSKYRKEEKRGGGERGPSPLGKKKEGKKRDI